MAAELGIIPALAGSTQHTPSSQRHGRDHPRACGEHHALSGMRPAIGGSSPRLRGALPVEFLAPFSLRIIPALAGSTKMFSIFIPPNWDHPRACGEHHYLLQDDITSEGSSPRLRGAQRGRHVIVDGHGIIPALAGSTDASGNPIGTQKDHPRACGEHSMYSDALLSSAGSSPRLRGAPHHAGNNALDGGIIPALAGSTPRYAPPHPETRDHPRACGEHDSHALTSRESLGSSPRLRGALWSR